MAGASVPRRIETWLATPEAANLLDPSHLHERDREEWANLQTARRRRDWASSRALRGAAEVTVDQSSSLSHSHGYAALSLAPGAVAVGVDLEWLAPREFRGMADVAYSAAECALLASVDDPQDLCATFYELWTLKEAFAKALHLPLVDALRHCRFIDAGLNWRADVPTTRRWRAMVFAPRPQLRLAVARVADAREHIDAPIGTYEWPRPRTRDWTVIRSLSGGAD
jgi:phosphopantetheinyl transferase (holo-ACP synthase)